MFAVILSFSCHLLPKPACVFVQGAFFKCVTEHDRILQNGGPHQSLCSSDIICSVMSSPLIKAPCIIQIANVQCMSGFDLSWTPCTS
jgi:hypothetical protein